MKFLEASAQTCMQLYWRPGWRLIHPKYGNTNTDTNKGTNTEMGKRQYERTCTQLDWGPGSLFAWPKLLVAPDSSSSRKQLHHPHNFCSNTRCGKTIHLRKFAVQLYSDKAASEISGNFSWFLAWFYSVDMTHKYSSENTPIIINDDPW